ncbi:MAG: amidohydrolase family protein [Jatrophihabitans sp.]|uniref:amidohydrolase family protein n=1 Tax=Jatrophihabitans sp. TaxID=1932789 RepID=UPI00390EDDE0
MSRLQGTDVLVVGAAFADGTSDTVRRDVTLLVQDGRIAGLWFDGDGPDRPVAGVPRIDGSGATIVPGLVDSHAHLSLPGGAQWIDRGFDPADELLDAGEDNGELMVRAGIRWARDVGAPRRPGADGRERALSLVLRDRWAGAHDRPYVRAAGTWLARSGSLPHGLAIEVEHGADLLPAVAQQLDDGADLVKLYLDGPDPDTAPFSAEEVRAAVDLAHGRGATVAAHSGTLPGARVGAEAGIDSLEHGFALDVDAATALAAHGVTLVCTLAVLRSWQSFRTTSPNPRFSEPDGITRIAARRERAEESVRLAARAGVAIAAGSDFGGGSLRANQLAWEVEALVGAGVEPHAALAAATWRGGDLFGDPDAGRVRIGGPAHFSLVHGDPLSDPAALWRVWLTR